MALPAIHKPAQHDWLRARENHGTLPDFGQKRRLLLQFVKFVLPLLALGFLMLMLLWPRLAEKETAPEFADTGVAASRDDLRMSSLRFTGMDGDNRPYLVTATSATQDPEDNELVHLENLQADVALDAGAWVAINARSGLMHSGLQTLQLNGQVEAYMDNGYAFYTESARIDLSRNSLYADQPLRIQGPLGRLRARTMLASNKGQNLHFAGDVRVMIYPRGGGA